MSSVRFFTQATSYGSLDSYDSPLKQGFAAHVDGLISEITGMISALAPEQSFMRDWKGFSLDQQTFLNIVTVWENNTSPNNDWPFNLNQIELRTFLLSINFDIEIYRKPNMRMCLYKDLISLTHQLSCTYMFTLEQCDLIRKYESVQWYRKLESEILIYVTKLNQGEINNPKLEIFADKINILICYLNRRFVSLNPVHFNCKTACDGKILAKQLVMLGIQLQPFFAIGTQDDDLKSECNSAFKSAVVNDDAVKEIDDSAPNRCFIM